MNEDEIAANFTFLTVEDSASDPRQAHQKRKRERDAADAHLNKVLIYVTRLLGLFYLVEHNNYLCKLEWVHLVSYLHTAYVCMHRHACM